jgi:hydroxyacylglutathione hydrolase
MLYLKSFTVNPFQQNTYILYNEEGSAFIIDPGNSTDSENKMIVNFIAEKKLRLERLLLTHAHIDHVLGNRFIFDTYGLLPEVHEADLYFIERMTQTASMYGVNCEASPLPEKYIQHGDVIQLGTYSLQCIHTPGHSPGSISFFIPESKLLISGDVLFRESIGRTDLPLGDHATLISAIKNKLFVLDEAVKVYSGHGPSTTIGYEKENNPFLS